MDECKQSVELEVSLHGDRVEGVIHFSARPDQRFSGYLELIQALETERGAATDAEREA